MGSSCGCCANAAADTPRVFGPVGNSPQPGQSLNSKFADINPVGLQGLSLNDFNLNLSDHNLNLLSHQISRRLNEFEMQNGLITMRFTNQCQEYDSKNMSKMNILPSFDKPQGNKQGQRNEHLQPYLPLTNEHINFEIDESASESLSSEQSAEKHKSCLLSQPSHILSNSIFTDRFQAKNQFYQKFSRMGSTELLTWNDANRVSYAISDEELRERMDANENPKFVIVLQVIKSYYQHHSLQLMSFGRDPGGLRLNFNGRKRLFPLALRDHEPSLCQISSKIVSLIGQYQISQMAYYLTGWIPQRLDMGDIKSFQGIFERLSSNIDEGNMLVFLSRKTQSQEQYVALTQIDLEGSLICVNPGNGKLSIPQILLSQELEDGSRMMKIEAAVEMFDCIHLSWNPTIYDTIINRQNQFTAEHQLNKYVVVIPPSSQDIQIRLFLQRHHSCDGSQQKQANQLLINLYEYEGTGDEEKATPIRTLQTNQNIFSDVFIFEECSYKTQYLLTVQQKCSSKVAQNISYTLTLLSFVEMQFNQLQQNGVRKKVEMKPQIKGFGLNSQYLNKNQHPTRPETQKYLSISVEVGALKEESSLIPSMKENKSDFI